MPAAQGPDAKNLIIRIINQTPAQPGTWQQTVGPDKRYHTVSQLSESLSAARKIAAGTSANRNNSIALLRAAGASVASNMQSLLLAAGKMEAQIFTQSSNLQEYEGKLLAYWGKLKSQNGAQQQQQQQQQMMANAGQPPQMQQQQQLMPPQLQQHQIQMMQQQQQQQQQHMNQTQALFQQGMQISPNVGQPQFPQGMPPQMMQQQQAQQQQQQLMQQGLPLQLPQQPMPAPQAPMMQINRSQMQPNPHLMTLAQQGGPQPISMQPQPSHQGVPQMMQHGVPQNPPLTPNDAVAIDKLTGMLIERAKGDGTFEDVQNQMNAAPAEAKQAWAARGVNPVFAHYKKQAIRMYQLQRAEQQRQRQQQQIALANQQASQEMNQSMPPMMQQMPNPMPQMRGNVNPSNIDYAQLQAAAQQAQEGGDLVVPASNNRVLNGQVGPLGRGLNTMVAPQQQMTTQPKKSKANQTPSQQNAQPQPQNQAKSAPNIAQAEAQARARQNQSNPSKSIQQQFQGQVGGLQSSPQIQQQSPALHMQQPVVQSIEQTPQQTMQQTPGLSSRNPTPASQRQPSQQQQVQPPNFAMQGGLPPQAQAQLARLPIQQQQQNLAIWGQQQQASAMQAFNPQQGNMQVNRQQQGLSRPQPQQGGMPDQRQAPPPQDKLPFNIDDLPIPKPALSGGFGLNLPHHIQTWRQFKEALRGNPGLAPQPLQQQILDIQRQQAAHEMRYRQQARINAAQQQMGPTSQNQPPQQQAKSSNDSLQNLIRTNAVEIVDGIARIKEPTLDEIQAYRAKTPKAAGMAEDRLRQFILSHRRRAVETQNPALFKQILGMEAANRNVMEKNNMQPPQQQAPSSVATHLQVPGLSMPALLTPGIPGALGSHLKHPSSSPALNVVQPSNFDLKLPNERQQAQAMMAGQANVNAQLQKFKAQEQWQKMTPEQQVKMEAQIRARQNMQAYAGVTNPSGPNFPGMPQTLAVTEQPQQPQMTDQQKAQRFEQLRKEALASTHLGLPLTIADEQKQKMSNACSQIGHFLAILEQILRIWYFGKPSEENTVRELMRMANMIRKQKPQQGEFYVSQEELFSMVLKIKAFLADNKALVENVRRMTAKPNAPAAAGPGSNQEAAKAQGQAGTTSKKPAEIKGHGAPVYAAPTQSSINLKLPEKKRRPGQGASPSPGPEVVITSITKPANKPATNARLNPAMGNLPPAPPNLPSKCPIPTCSYHVSGFATDAEAEKHASQEHRYTGNALNWMLETVKSALGVAGDIPKLKDANKIGKLDGVKLFATTTIVAHAANTKTNLSAPIPVSSKPATATTLKAPIATQSSKLQQGNTKPGSPSGANTSVKRTAGALGDGAAEGSPSKKPAVTFQDSWTASLVTREAVHETFSGLPDLMLGARMDTPEVPLPVFASQTPVNASELTPVEKQPLSVEPASFIPVLLSDLPSPPPVTWEDTPESVDANASPKEIAKESDAAFNDFFRKEGNPFGMHADEVDFNYSFDFGSNQGLMNFQDSGVGLDSYEFSPQDLYQQVYMQSLPQQLDLNALIAQQHFVPS